jgi:ankyrin repeat protein
VPLLLWISSSFVHLTAILTTASSPLRPDEEVCYILPSLKILNYNMNTHRLMSAASQGHASVVKLLLDATALNAAVRSSKDSKSDSSSKEVAPVVVDAATHSGGTALMFAAEGTLICS